MEPRQGTCPSCEHTFRVPASITAAKVRCPKCKAVVELPPVAEAAAPAGAARATGASGAPGAKRPSRARAGAAKEAKPAAQRSAASGARARPSRGARPAPAKKNPLPLVIGGVVVIAVIAFVATKMGGSSPEPQAAAPAVVAKPDLSHLADLEPAEGTNEEQWAEMEKLMTTYITPPFTKSSERSGDLMIHKGKRSVPAILNAYKRLDFTTQEGTDIGWKMQSLLLQNLCKVNYGWVRATRAEDVAANVKVIERWFAAWNRAKLDDAVWEEIANEAKAEQPSSS